ncbi:MAG: hypothetical protein IKB01_06875 [Lachnospiraceae bacterium]|nr:hypothetical protein [Lachnospiraceae bacterium]
MGANDYKEDLEYLYSALITHPSIMRGEKNAAELESLYLTNCERVHDYVSLIDAATELTVFFCDGHTNIEIPYTVNDLCLNLKCCWDGVKCNNLIMEE